MFDWSPKRRVLGRSHSRKGGRLLSVGAVVLIAAAIALVWFGQRYPERAAEARARLAGPVSSIAAMLQWPLAPLKDLGQRYRDFLTMEDELNRLRLAKDELEGWKWRALELERQLSDLRALTQVVQEPGFEFITASVRARSIGIGSNSVLVGAGQKNGVAAGSAVLNARGLVGTAYEVGRDTMRVRFLTDAGSQIGVSIGRRLVSAVAEGTGRRLLDIRDGGRSFEIADGDEVISAGQEGGVPRGLRIGRVVGTASGLRIAPYVDFDRVEYVSVLLPVDGRAGQNNAVAGGGRVAAQIDANSKAVGAPSTALGGE